MDFGEILGTILFGLIFVGLVAAFILIIFGPLILIGWAVFSVISSPVDPLVKGVIFAMYTVGVFIIGAYMAGSTYEEKMETIKELVTKCEEKVASISGDVRRCGRNVRNVVDSKVYDVVKCIEAIRENL